MKQTILLTGSTGFLGSNLLAALIQRGYQLIVLKRSFSNTRRIDNLLNDVVVYDIDKEEIDKIFHDHHIDIVIHTATEYGRDARNSIVELVKSNILFPSEIIEQSLKKSVFCFINTDTFFSKNCRYSYLAAYTLSKKHFHDWLNLVCYNSDMKIVNMMVHHVFGAGDDQHKFTSSLLRNLAQEIDNIPMTFGEQKRDFIHISDVVEAYMTVLEKMASLPQYIQYEVGSGKSTTIKDFSLLLKSKIDLALDRSTQGTLSFGKLPYREGEPMHALADITRLSDIGWKPKLTLEEGVEAMVREELAMISETVGII